MQLKQQPNAIETAAGAATNADAIKVAQPAPNTTQEVSLEPGQKYVCDFDPANAALVEIKDGQMILTFADGSQVIINNYSEVMAGDLPAELTVADGTVINGEELLTEVTEVEEIEEKVVAKKAEKEPEPEVQQVANVEPASGEEIAEALAQVEPAAGEGPTGNTGYGFNSSPVDVPLGSPLAIGPLGPTALRYGIPQTQGDNPFLAVQSAPQDDRPIITSDDLLLDETNLLAGTISQSGNVTVNYGSDGPGTLTGNGSFAASGNVLGGTLASGGVPVVVTFDAGTNTYTGDAGGTTVFTFVLDPITGDYTYTQYEQFDHSDTTDDNEPIFLDFGVDATDNDNDTTTANIRVTVLDDGPVALSQVAQTVDETNMVGGVVSTSGQFFATPGQDVPGMYVGTNTFNATGSLAGGTLTSGGVAVVVTFDAGTNTYTGSAGGTTVFTLVLDMATGTYDFTLFQPIDHADAGDPNDEIQLNFGAGLKDYDGDVATGTLVVKVLDDGPVATTSSAAADESDATVTASGTLVLDYGNDTAAAVNPAVVNGNFTAGGSLAGGTLTSNGVPVVVTFNAGTNTYTGSAGGSTVFTLTFNGTTGGYTYTQVLPLDHADGTDDNDVITLNFGIDVVDRDGDSTDSTITINVADDAPDAVGGQNTVDESDLPGPVVVTGTVTPDYGFDGAGTFETTGTFASSGSQLAGALTSNGFPVIVTFDGGTNTYTGTANGNDIFTMTINPDGTYRFELLGTLDHADPNNPNDIINLDFGIRATDNDTDTDDSVIRIRVKDDVPTIGNSAGDVDETNLDGGPLTYTDTLDHNFGLDLGTISANGTTSSSTPLFSCGFPVTITNTGTTYTGMANGMVVFTLVIDPATGEYTYTQYEALDHPDTNDHDDVISINFGVAITSVDGDNDTGTITINVADDGPDAVEDITSAEESQFITGDVRANDILSQDGDDTGDNTVTNVHFNGTDYPVPAGGFVTIVTPFGTLKMNSDGTYEYTAANNDPNGTDVFTYTLTDKDGDSDTATLSVVVTPDGTPVAVSELLAVDETNLTPGPMIFNGDLNVDFGLDGAGTVTANGNFAPSGSLAGGTLTSGGVPVTVSLAGNVYTGTAGATVIFTLTINNDGTYSFQLFDNIDHADGTDPNDIIQLDFGVTVADADGDTADGTVTILVHDDAPVAIDDGQTVLNEGQTVNGNVTTNDELSEDNPTPVVEVIFNGTSTAVPTVGNAVIVGTYGTLTINSNGVYSYTANNNNPDGVDEFTYVLQDYDGDRETAEISFKVNPIDDNPIIVTPPPEIVDETNLPGGPLMETGTISVNYGTDGPGEVNPNGIFTSTGSIATGSLKSCGFPVTVTLTGNTYTGVANGVTVFTMEILENGNYTFKQFQGLDHANTANHNDVIDLNFGATATDSDGDTASTTVTVRVYDDGPDIGTVTHAVDETSLNGGTINVNGTIPNDFGGDGAGSITPNGLFQALFQMNGLPVTLSSGGVPIVVSTTANGYEGKANGVTIFSLTIDPTNGNYNYQQFDTIDHPDANNPDDVIWLKFYVDITDCDGDHDTGTIVIDVHDDGPNAVNDTNTVTRTQTSVTGNVLTNDTYGADGPGSLMTTGTFVGTYGTLVLNANGSYTYTRNGQAGGVDTFNYMIKDFDGDSDTATLTINVQQDHNPINISGTGETDDTNVTDVENGTINVNYQGDGPGTTTGNNTFSASGNLLNGNLTHNGTPVVVTFNAGTNVYTGSAGGSTIFTMQINANGTYQFIQYDNLDHSIAGNNNEALFLNFGVTATDSDGDTGNGTVTITVRDDGPNAVNDTASVGRFNNTATGNVLNNDTFGQDGAGALTTPGTYFGAFGVLVLNANGSYTYTRYGTNGGTDTFNYTIRDFDGDTDTAQLTVSVTANPPPPPPPPPPWWGDGDGGGDGGDGGDGTPLVLDLDGDGIELVSKEDGVQFDMGPDGIMDQTAWVAADDGLLAIDLNGDGTINDHSELFGTLTVDGFTILAQYDQNGDGVIDANDDVWDDLVVWQDANQDGISQENEMFHLSDFGIVGINTNAQETDYYINGQWISHDSTFIYEDGSVGQIVDAWFQYDPIDNVHVSSGDGGASYAAIDGESDLFLFQAISDSAKTITGFNAAEGDVIDLSLLVEGASDVNDAINDFVYVTEQDGNTIISVDIDGAAGPAEAVEVAKLEGVTGTSAEELLNNGTIVV